MAAKKLKVEHLLIKFDQVKPAAYNPRTISDEAFKGLSKSIDTFGLVQGLVWNKRSGNLVGGHQRYKVLKAKGLTEEVMAVVDLDDKAEKTLNVTLNNSHISGEFTPDLVAVLEEIQAHDSDLFDALRLDGLIPVSKDEPHADTSEEKSFDRRYEVIAEVDGEAEQQDLFNRLEGEGYKVRVLTL